MSAKRPLVSLGLPVYNGENFVAQAIESVLAQTFRDFELIITDNASTDGTQVICERYAAQDNRINYCRNPQNLGAGPNFNRAVTLAQGEYFKWVAHDDLIAPTFLAKCVAVLEQDPLVVLCFADTAIIDEQGEYLAQYAITLTSDHQNPASRYRSLLLDWHMCFDIFGLIRTDLLRQTALMGNYGHGDGVLLARLALLGRFAKIKEVLFYSRQHAKQSMRQFGYAIDRGGNDYHAYAQWFNTAYTAKLTMPQWRILYEYYLSLWQVTLGFVPRLQCHLYLLRWAIRNRHGLLGDLRYAARFFCQKMIKRRKQPAPSMSEAH